MDRDFHIAMLCRQESLSFLDQLCVQSFLDAGHHVILYGYGAIDRVPGDVEQRDASEILAQGNLPADAHADLFRYRLLAQSQRVIWADLDAYCHQPLRPIDGHLYGWESPHYVSGGVLAMPSDSATLQVLLEVTRSADAPVQSGDWGAKALTQALHQTGEIARALPQSALYPISFSAHRGLLRPDVDFSQAIRDTTQSIHLYGPRLTKLLRAQDHALPHPDSLIGSLLHKHGIDPKTAPLPGRAIPRRSAAHSKGLQGAPDPKQSLPEVPEASDIRPLEDVVAITTMKNEGPFILDWIAYHLSVGITHFLVYTNDCSDPTNALLDALGARGLVTRIDNPVKEGERPQRVALALAQDHPRVTSADAFIVMDVDEYINVHTGDGTLTALFAACDDPDMISMTWRFFGSGGVIDYKDAPVAAQFTKAAPLKVRKPHQNWGFKTLVRKGTPYTKLGVHRPLEPKEGPVGWVNGSGAAMPEDYRTQGWRSNLSSWGYDLVTLNHYATRSVDSFLVKRDRGRTNHINRDQGVAYWNLHNRNDEDDTSIFSQLARASGFRKMLAADPVIADTHRAAVRWHERRIKALKRDAEFANLHAVLSQNALSHSLDETALETTQSDPRAKATSEPIFESTRGRKVPTPKKAAAKRDPQVTMNDKDADRPRNAFGDLILLGDENEFAFKALLDRIEPRYPMLQPLDARLPHDSIVIVSAMKNEGCFILEWIAHHMAIGVTHFLIYTNDCDDPTNALLDRLQDLGHVTRVDNPFNRDGGQKPQRGALNDAINHPVVKSADWVGVIDVDEFITIHQGDRTLPGLFAEMNDPNIVSMTWRFFGTSDQHAYEDAWITERFTQCAPRYLPRPRLGWGFKTFVHRSAPYAKLGVHRPLDIDTSDGENIRWVNGSGRQMPDKTVNNTAWFSRKASIGYNLVTLNHYILRSAESFLVKRERGRINHVDQDQGMSYWAERNYTTETDHSIRAQIPAAKKVLATLLRDAPLAKLHQDAVAWHRARIATLMQDPDYRTLYKAITDPKLPDAVYTAGSKAAAE